MQGCMDRLGEAGQLLGARWIADLRNWTEICTESKHFCREGEIVQKSCSLGVGI